MFLKAADKTILMFHESSHMKHVTFLEADPQLSLWSLVGSFGKTFLAEELSHYSLFIVSVYRNCFS